MSLNRFGCLNDLEVSKLELLIMQHGDELLKNAINQNFTEKSLNQLVCFNVISEREKSVLLELLDGHCISEYLSNCSEFDHLEKVSLLALGLYDFDYAANLAIDYLLVNDLSEAINILIPENINEFLHNLVYESNICDLELFAITNRYVKPICTDLGNYYLVCKKGSL